jgi:hypothetical protein
MAKPILKRSLVALILVAVAAVPLQSHNSFAAEFDVLKRVTLTGVINKVDWGNPHVRFFFDVKDDATGTVTTWGAESASPNVLLRNGWTRNTLKVGMLVSITGSVAKDGSRRMNATRIEVDGKPLDPA